MDAFESGFKALNIRRSSTGGYKSSGELSSWQLGTDRNNLLLLLHHSELRIQVVISLSNHDIKKIEKMSWPSGISRQMSTSVSKWIKMWRSLSVEKIKVHV